MLDLGFPCGTWGRPLSPSHSETSPPHSPPHFTQGSNWENFCFRRWNFFHICPKQGQETMKSPSVTLELIKEGMKLTFQRTEDPKVIILCWCRGKLKECSFHLFSSQVTTPFWWANDIHLVLKVQPLEGICSKSLHTTSWDLSNAKRHRQILRADALS